MSGRSRCLIEGQELHISNGGHMSAEVGTWDSHVRDSVSCYNTLAGCLNACIATTNTGIKLYGCTCLRHPIGRVHSRIIGFHPPPTLPSPSFHPSMDACHLVLMSPSAAGRLLRGRGSMTD